VGKTSLAASRAINLASKNNKVLLITIDPSLRLKDLLGLSDDDPGTVKTVQALDQEVDVLLMSPTHTFEKLRSSEGAPTLNRILKILTKPHGGLIEILSLIELSQQYNSNQYDYIVLDTAPGGHFLDFLKSSEKIMQFFDKKFMEVFRFLGVGDEEKKPGILKKIVSSGIDKIIGYLEKVTNKDFIQEFLDAIKQVYALKESFLQSVNMTTVLKNSVVTKWFLVTSTEQLKVIDALEIKKNTEKFSSKNQYVLVNKSHEIELNLELNNIKDPQTKSIIESLIQREVQLKSELSQIFSSLLLFPEINSDMPTEQLKILFPKWSDYEL
jgi:anion-transporting  ArsA/GET3 family ATPase